MSLELYKEQIKINQLVGEEYTQTLVEGDIIVPDIKPDIAKILQVDGQAVVTGKEIQHGRVIINGIVNFKILYVPDQEGESIKSINAGTNFSHTIDIENARQDMNVMLESDVEHLEFDMTNSRKLNVKAVVSINCKVINNPVLDFVVGISGEQHDIQVLKKKINAYNIVAYDAEEFIITEDLEVPAGKPSIDDLLKVDVKIGTKDIKVIDDKIIIKGSFFVCTLYTSYAEEGTIQFMEHEVPFTEVLSMEGVTEDMYCDTEYEILKVYSQLKEDNDGDIRILSIENTLKVSAKASEKVSHEVVFDAYSPEGNMELKKIDCSIDEIVEENKVQAAVKDVIELPSDIPGIVQIYNVVTKPYISQTKVESDNIIVEGIIDTYILYLSDVEENPIYSYKQEVPFSRRIDVKGVQPDMACDIKIETDHISYSMSTSDELEIRYVLGVSFTVIKTSKVEVISEAQLLPDGELSYRFMPSIVIYFVQTGDTLWKIAKRYHTTICEIVRMNCIENPDLIYPGQMLLIPRRQRMCV